MKAFFTFFIIVMTIGCVRHQPVSNLFRWEKISPAADSLTVNLERAFIERESTDSISRLICRLDSLVIDGVTEARANALFWRARLINREHNSKEAAALLREAVATNDSSRRPYTHLRIKYLLAITEALDKGRMYKELKKFEEFYHSISDPFMTANVFLDLGHIMREVGNEKRCIGYYLKADSIYARLGIDTYHLKTSLNNATILFETGDSVASRNIIVNLLENDKTRADRDFYINVLVKAYHIMGDTAALLSAWEKIEESGLNRSLMRSTALELGRHYLETGDMERAGYFCRRAADGFTPLTPLSVKAQVLRLMAEVSEAKGEKENAIYAYRRHMLLQDSIMSERSAVEIGNMESRGEIARSEAELESRHQIERLWTWIFVMALVVAALVVTFLFMRRIQASKLAITRYHLDLERERRSLVSSALVMEEKDNVLESVLADIHKMEQDGRLKAEETRHLEQNVKMHLSGRQDWAHFRELFDKVHPMFHKRLKERYPDLTEGDLRLATYIKVGMQGKQIARMLMLQPDTIRKNRQKLRRHLGLSSEESLEDLLRTIDS